MAENPVRLRRLDDSTRLAQKFVEYTTAPKHEGAAQRRLPLVASRKGMARFQPKGVLAVIAVATARPPVYAVKKNADRIVIAVRQLAQLLQNALAVWRVQTGPGEVVDTHFRQCLTLAVALAPVGILVGGPGVITGTVVDDAGDLFGAQGCDHLGQQVAARNCFMLMSDPCGIVGAAMHALGEGPEHCAAGAGGKFGDLLGIGPPHEARIPIRRVHIGMKMDMNSIGV